MEKRVQFSIFLVNKPGVLSRIFSELAKAKINVTSLVMMDSVEHGVLRMIVEDAKAGSVVFKQLDVPVTQSDVLAVTLILALASSENMRAGRRACTTTGFPPPPRNGIISIACSAGTCVTWMK